MKIRQLLVLPVVALMGLTLSACTPNAPDPTNDPNGYTLHQAIYVDLKDLGEPTKTSKINRAKITEFETANEQYTSRSATWEKISTSQVSKIATLENCEENPNSTYEKTCTFNNADFRVISAATLSGTYFSEDGNKGTLTLNVSVNGLKN